MKEIKTKLELDGERYDITATVKESTKEDHDSIWKTFEVVEFEATTLIDGIAETFKMGDSDGLTSDLIEAFIDQEDLSDQEIFEKP